MHSLLRRPGRYGFSCALAALLLASPAQHARAQTPSVAFSAGLFSGSPNTGLALVGVSLSGAASEPVVATVTTIDGTALTGIDYVPTITTLTWAPTDSPLKVFAVPLLPTGGGDRTFSVQLQSSSGAVFGNPAIATVSIVGSGLDVGEIGSVTLSWSAPTANIDGTALTDLAGYNVYAGPYPYGLSRKLSVGADLQSCQLGGLAAGTWYFEITAINAEGIESAPAGPVSITL